MNIGSWKVGTEQVEYSGNSFQRFVIPVKEIPEVLNVPDGEGPMYKWIVLATADDSLSIDDLYDLNFALMYAAGRAGLTIDYSVFDRTVEYQFSLLDVEDDEQDEVTGSDEDDAEAEQKRKDALTERD